MDVRRHLHGAFSDAKCARNGGRGRGDGWYGLWATVGKIFPELRGMIKYTVLMNNKQK